MSVNSVPIPAYESWYPSVTPEEVAGALSPAEELAALAHALSQLAGQPTVFTPESVAPLLDIDAETAALYPGGRVSMLVNVPDTDHPDYNPDSEINPVRPIGTLVVFEGRVDKTAFDRELQERGQSVSAEEILGEYAAAKLAAIEAARLEVEEAAVRIEEEQADEPASVRVVSAQPAATKRSRRAAAEANAVDEPEDPYADVPGYNKRRHTVNLVTAGFKSPKNRAALAETTYHTVRAHLRSRDQLPEDAQDRSSEEIQALIAAKEYTIDGIDLSFLFPAKGSLVDLRGGSFIDIVYRTPGLFALIVAAELEEKQPATPTDPPREVFQGVVVDNTDLETAQRQIVRAERAREEEVRGVFPDFVSFNDVEDEFRDQVRELFDKAAIYGGTGHPPNKAQQLATIFEMVFNDSEYVSELAVTEIMRYPTSPRNEETVRQWVEDMRANGLKGLAGVRGADRLMRKFASTYHYDELWHILISPIATPEDFRLGMRDLLNTAEMPNAYLHRLFWHLYDQDGDKPNKERARILRATSLLPYIYPSVPKRDRTAYLIAARGRALSGQRMLVAEADKARAADADEAKLRAARAEEHRRLLEEAAERRRAFIAIGQRAQALIEANEGRRPGGANLSDNDEVGAPELPTTGLFAFATMGDDDDFRERYEEFKRGAEHAEEVQSLNEGIRPGERINPDKVPAQADGDLALNPPTKAAPIPIWLRDPKRRSKRAPAEEFPTAPEDQWLNRAA